MELKEFMKNRKRMCLCLKCNNCGLYKINTTCGLYCDEFIVRCPQEAEAIVQKWVDEHPVQTNIDKFAEIFGIDPIEIEGLDKTTYQGFCDWWSEEYIPPEREEE